jgi:hypothetical protein
VDVVIITHAIMKTQQKFLKRISILTKLSTWLSRWFFPGLVEPSRAITRWHRWVHASVKKRGWENTILTLKDARARVLHYVGSGTGSLPSILPSWLRREIRCSNPEAIKLALTILMIGRSFTKGGEPDWTPITAPSSYNPDRIQELVTWIEEIGINHAHRIEGTWESLHYTAKSGPSGPALQTCMNDLKNLPPKLKEAIISIAPGLSNLFLQYEMSLPMQLKTWAESLGIKKGRESKLRVIAIRQDRELKLRPFAILDYWSQTALKPLHEELLETLRSIPNDYTFDQQAGGKYLSTLTPRGSYHSLDLTSATDRFPMDLQEAVLSLLTNKEYAASWRHILVDYPFCLTTDINREIYYNAGQPMGAYSSWAMFTLCHHYIVKYVAGDIKFRHYAMLGDDIVIADDVVAARYVQYIKDIGVEINMSKTLVSPNTFEFAKHLYHKGQDVSGFPISGMYEMRKIPTMVYLFIAEQIRSRGFQPSQPLLSYDLFKDLYDRLGAPVPAIRKILYPHWRRIVLFPFAGLLEDPVKDARRFLIESGLRVSCNTSNDWCYQVCAEYFATIYANTTLDALKSEVERFQACYSDKTLEALSVPAEVTPQEFVELPQMVANRNLVQDVGSYGDRIRGLVREGKFEEIFEHRTAVIIADPVWIFSGSRTRIILGATARLVGSTAKLVSNVQFTIDTELAKETDQDNSGYAPWIE